MKIAYAMEIPSSEKFALLYVESAEDAAFPADPAPRFESLSHSWHALSAYDGDHLVGVGLVQYDGALGTPVLDIIVASSYKQRGIDEYIHKLLLAECKFKGIGAAQLASEKQWSLASRFQFDV